MRIHVIEASITEVGLKGDGAEQFGVRPMFDPVLAEHPSRLATLERQLLLINSLPGVRIVDSPWRKSAEHPVVSAWWSVEDLACLRLSGLDNLGSSTVGPWQTYATAAFNSFLRPAICLP